MVRKICWWDVPPEHAYKHRMLLISAAPTLVTIVGQDAVGNHERIPISPIAPKGEVPKPWKGSLFRLFPIFWWSMSCHLVKRTLSAFFLGEVPKPWQGPYFPYYPYGWSAKTMRRSLFSLFPLFWWPMSNYLVKTWTTKIGEIAEIGNHPWFWHFNL